MCNVNLVKRNIRSHNIFFCVDRCPSFDFSGKPKTPLIMFQR